MLRKGMLGAAITILALGVVARADDSAVSRSSDASETSILNPVIWADDQAAATPAPAAVPAEATGQPPEGAIMWGLDQVGVGQLMKKLDLSITGYGELGYFYDLTVPKNIAPGRSSPPTFVKFPGDYKNHLLLDQLDLDIQRIVGPGSQNPNQFDIGFNVEAFYGSDAVYTHADGILDNGNKHDKTTPDNDLDLEQANLLFFVPVGGGLLVTVGKFDALFGYETINPTNPSNDPLYTQLYTHSYQFSYGTPFTQTGILAAYNLTNAIKVSAGITRGWDQATSDNNGAIDFIAQAEWTVSNALSATVNLSEGPELTGDNHDYWTVVEGLVGWQVSDQLKVAADLLYGDANATAQWYGIAGYVHYSLNNYVAANFRAELYHDGRGFTTGVGGTDINYIEGTLGLAITPTPNVNLLQTLTLRPEVRIDTADHAVFDGRKFTQATCAMDAYIRF